MAKLRIDGFKENNSVRDIRELLEEFGTVGEVSIHSLDYLTYALAEMEYHDADRAAEQLDESRWQGTYIRVRFANCMFANTWLPIHQWKAPKKERW